ncbi:MAG: hypothetical protein KC486_25685 [Myxococcales bacterium]|nr:hypothetical protein [Myxococcales bacterium]
MRIAGVIFLTLVAFLTLVWFFLLRAPSPEVVCDHIIEMTVAEVGDKAPNARDALIDQLRLRCTKEKRTKLRLRGKYYYAEYAKCVMRSETLAEAEGC